MSWSPACPQRLAGFTRLPAHQTHATLTNAIQNTREVAFCVTPNWVNPTNPVEIELVPDG